MSFYYILIFLIVYLICSINPAIIICKKKTGEDIRKLGSGNAGSANAVRVLGKPLGALVIILDVLKVLLSYYIVTKISEIFKVNIDYIVNSIFILATVIGHGFPIYYKFKGGKGVIVGITAALLINKNVAICALIIGFIVFIITRICSLSTLCGLVVYLVMSIVMMPEYIVSVLIASAIVLLKHRQSIQRLITKQEWKLN